MHFRSKVTLLTFLTLAAFAPAALAGAPKPEDPTIVPGVSIGGVSLGQPESEAEAAWGNRGDCGKNGQLRVCEYGSGRRGMAVIGFDGGEVAFVSISAGLDGKEWRFAGPLLEFGTAKGDLGLGDKAKRVAKRYPQGKFKGGRTVIFKDAGTRMIFAGDDAVGGRVIQISLISTDGF